MTKLQRDLATLRPGDTLVLANGDKQAFDRYYKYGEYEYPIRGDNDCWTGAGRFWDSEKTDPKDIVRVIRKRAEKRRDDKDAVWLLSHLASATDDDNGWLAIQTLTSQEAYNRRLRRIAKRLNGGKAVMP